VLSIAKGETSAAETARKHSLTIAEIERWQEQFFAAGENALRARPKDEEAAEDEQVERLKKKVGELVLDIDILGGGEQGPPFRAGDVRRVRAAIPQALRAPPLPAARRSPLKHAHCAGGEAPAPSLGCRPGRAHPEADRESVPPVSVSARDADAPSVRAGAWPLISVLNRHDSLSQVPRRLASQGVVYE